VDIVAGTLLGAALALFNYFLKYPPLWDQKCELPKRRWYEKKSASEWANYYDSAEQAEAPSPPAV